MIQTSGSQNEIQKPLQVPKTFQGHLRGQKLFHNNSNNYLSFFTVVTFALYLRTDKLWFFRHEYEAAVFSKITETVTSRKTIDIFVANDKIWAFK